jgi:hypothetical protein
MRKILASLLFVTTMAFTAKSQDTKAEFLKEPSTWSFERFSLPPVFSPGFPYKGVEELRFSPGMFNKDSSGYFSYAFIAQLDNTTSMTQSEIKNYLITYFKGLCASTAKERHLSIDTSQVAVSIEKKSNVPPGVTVYNALLNVFGVFADGAPVTLNAEIKVLNDINAKNSYLVFIASPHKKTDDIWEQLYKIQNDFRMPAR